MLYNATDEAIIEGEVEGYPVPTVFFYQLFDNSMEVVGPTLPSSIIALSLSHSLACYILHDLYIHVLTRSLSLPLSRL